MVILYIILGYIVTAGLLVFFFMKNDHGAKEPIPALLEAVGMGLVGLALAFVLEMLLISQRDMLLSRFISSGDPRAVMAGVRAFLMVGIIEELVKLLPLVLFIYKRPYFSEYTDGVIYFGLAGLAFGLGENLMYLFHYGSGVGLMRLVLMPYFHAALTGIIGYYVVRQKILHKREFGWTLISAVAIAIGIHALYDFAISSGNGALGVVGLMVLVLLTTGLILYDQHASELDRALVRAGAAPDRFCRRCGAANPRGTKFCERCGQTV